jgi:hypothetical protein
MKPLTVLDWRRLDASDREALRRDGFEPTLPLHICVGLGCAFCIWHGTKAGASAA